MCRRKPKILNYKIRGIKELKITYTSRCTVMKKNFIAVHLFIARNLSNFVAI